MAAESRRHQWPTLLVLVGLTFLVYLPVALSDYMFNDDYLLIIRSREHPRRDPLYVSLIGIGRPVFAELTFCVLKRYLPFFPNMGFFVLLRLISVLAIAVSAILFFRWLLRWVPDIPFAAGMTVLMFTLPGFQVLVSYSICSAYAMSVTVILLSLLLLSRAGVPESLAEALSRRHLLFTSGSILLLCIGFFWYQGTSFLFMAFAVAVLFFANHSARRWRAAFLQHTGVFCAALAAHILLDAVILKPIVRGIYPMLAKQAVHRPPPLEALSDLTKVPHNLKALTGFLTKRAFNLWVVRDEFSFAFCVMALFLLSAVGFLVYRYLQGRGRPTWKRLSEVIEGCAYLVVSLVLVNAVQIFYAPNANFRVLLPYSASALIVLCWPLGLVRTKVKKPTVRRISTVLIYCACAVTSALGCWNTLVLFAKWQIQEFEVFHTAIRPFLQQKAGALDITSRPRRDAVVRSSEFGRFSSYGGMPLYGMVLRAFAQQHAGRPSSLRHKIVIEQWRGPRGPVRFRNKDVPPERGVARVNLDRLLRPLFAPRPGRHAGAGRRP